MAAPLVAGFLATLGRPAWWALALGGFLVRGGVLVLLLPIVRLPTSAGLANDLAPTLVSFVFGGPSVGFLVIVGSAVALGFAWLVGGGLLGGWLDLALVREAAADDEADMAPPPLGGDPVRALLARLAAHVPTLGVLAWGSVRLVDATYQELVNPGDPSLPVPLRVALRIPEVVGQLVGAWAIGEAVGGLAVRQLAWGASLPRSLGRAVLALVRPSGLVVLVVTNLAVGAAVVGAATAAAASWEHLRVMLVDGRGALEVRLALVLFAVTWAAGLWLVSLAAAWRATAWTFEVARHLAPRTIEPPAG